MSERVFRNDGGVVGLTGPMFDGVTYKSALGEMAHAMTDSLAKEGLKLIKGELKVVLQHPTGFYESKVRIDRSTQEHATVTDGGVIYGPWLEGTSSRNRTTRFKGYSTFRRMSQQLNSRVPGIGRDALGRFVKRMNG